MDSKLFIVALIALHAGSAHALMIDLIAAAVGGLVSSNQPEDPFTTADYTLCSNADLVAALDLAPYINMTAHNKHRKPIMDEDEDQRNQLFRLLLKDLAFGNGSVAQRLTEPDRDYLQNCLSNHNETSLHLVRRLNETSTGCLFRLSAFVKPVCDSHEENDSLL